MIFFRKEKMVRKISLGVEQKSEEELALFRLLEPNLRSLLKVLGFYDDWPRGRANYPTIVTMRRLMPIWQLWLKIEGQKEAAAKLAAMPPEVVGSWVGDMQLGLYWRELPYGVGRAMFLINLPAVRRYFDPSVGRRPKEEPEPEEVEAPKKKRKPVGPAFAQHTWKMDRYRLSSIQAERNAERLRVINEEKERLRQEQLKHDREVWRKTRKRLGLD